MIQYKKIVTSDFHSLTTTFSEYFKHAKSLGQVQHGNDTAKRKAGKMSPAVPPKALTGVVPSLVELKVLPKGFKSSIWTRVWDQWLYIQTENPNPKNYICASVFPLSPPFPSLPLCTHTQTFLLLFAVWKTQRFLKNEKLVVKSCTIFRVAL